MTLSRREFLRLAGLVAGGVTVSACSPIYRELSGPPGTLNGWPPLSTWDFQVLSRLTYGPTEQDRLDINGLGWKSWIEMQLSPESIEDQAVDWRLRSLESIGSDPDGLADWDKEVLIDELKQAALLRRVYSHRQLYERMVEFWSDHFNISVWKGDCWFLKAIDDREVIRQHALGDFRDLLWASAHSPAMLVYLDNQVNEGAAPNENYARELMELHSLGVDGGYSQSDVMELARCLTGWTVKQHFWQGQFTFNPDLHDPEPKFVLGRRVEPAGQREAESVLEELALHPSTARHVAIKLLRRFVSETPPARLIEDTAQTFLATHGSIRAVLDRLLLDVLPEWGAKVKRPNDFIAGGLRILAADTDGARPIQDYLRQMGQPAFEWPTPDGPPDRSDYWISNLMPRWRFALALAQNQISGTTLDLDGLATPAGGDTLKRMSELLLGLQLDPELSGGLQQAIGQVDEQTQLRLSLAGLLASPGFQWH